MSSNLVLHAVPSGTCARLARSDEPPQYSDVVAVERFESYVPFSGILELYQTLIGQRWGPGKPTSLWGLPARDRFHRALVGDRPLGGVTGSDAMAVEEALLTMEEVATLGGPAIAAEDLDEGQTWAINQYRTFYRSLEPGEEAVYTLLL